MAYDQAKPTTLYRHFDAGGRLLYVGISKSAIERLHAHESGSRWVNSIARVSVERYATRQGAAQAERRAIETERPKHNIVHNRKVASELAQADTIGKRIRALRRSMPDQSTLAFAQAVGISRSAVSQWETGRVRNIRPDHLLAAARYFDVSIESLVEPDSPDSLQSAQQALSKTQLDRAAIGARFRDARVRAGLTQQDIAERCELTYQAVQNYEAGRNTPTVRTLAMFCKATDTSADWLLFGDQ